MKLYIESHGLTGDLPPAGAVVQFVFASLMGFALYVLRRGSGTLLLPMVAHAAWDLVSLGSQVAHGRSEVSSYFQLSTCGVAIISVVAVLRHGRSDRLLSAWVSA